LEFRRRLTHAQSTRQSSPDSRLFIFSQWGPTKPLSSILGPRKPGTDSFLDHRPLEFGKHAHHAEQRLAGRRSCVDALLMQEKVNAERMDLGQEGAQVLQAAAKPIDRPGHDYIELPLGGIVQQGIKLRALVSALGATDAVVLVDLGDLQATASSHL